MTFNSIGSFTSQRELATSGMFACSLTAFPVASLPSDSLTPMVIDNRSDRGFLRPRPHCVLSWRLEGDAAATTDPHESEQPLQEQPWQ